MHFVAVGRTTSMPFYIGQFYRKKVVNFAIIIFAQTAEGTLGVKAKQ